MSDPVTNVEIEDVLSSIRKLVSQDGSTRDAAAGGTSAVHAPPPEQEERAPTALVLTPDHRVDEAPDAASVATMRERAASAVRTELERAIEELETTMGIAAAERAAALDRRARELEARATEAAPENAPESVPLPTADERADHSEDWREDGPVHQAHGEAQDQPGDDAEPQDAPEITAVATDSAQGEEDEDYEIDWDAPVGRSFDGPPPEFDVDAQQGDVYGRSPQVDALEASEADLPDETEAEERSVLEAIRIVSDAAEPVAEGYDEAHEGDVFSSGATLEMVADDLDDLDQAAHSTAEAGTNAAADVDVDGEAFEPPEPPFDETHNDPFPGADAAAPQGPLDADVTLDEEMLRDMVADIVRRELQGELGERITRNVRKLVRREINRALAGQDLI